MIDLKGNLVSNKESLIKLHEIVYEDRLEYKDIRPEWKDIKDLQNKLFQFRSEASSLVESPDWAVNQVEKICKKLKNGKARDEYGIIYELFKEPLAGQDLYNSLTLLFNGIKHDMFIPGFMQTMGITSLYKNKGKLNDFKNQRGIFNLTKVRGILDKVIYEEVYDDLDENMSDSNVGGRRGRNIRDNLFIIYAIINDVKNGEAKPICMQTLDIYKCFDEMDFDESHNGLYDVGLQNNLFKLVAKLDDKCTVKVKTPCGSTDSFNLERLVMQGSVFGPLKCSVQIDTLGRDMLRQNNCLYSYKNIVDITALAMVDDVCSVNECHADSVEANATINVKMELKKLRLSKDKCYQIHVDKNKADTDCKTKLKVHEAEMKKESFGSYLGDIISSDGTIDLTVENRRQKGVGICSQITGMINNLSLGFYYFKIALNMRESMLVNGILTNSEVWYLVREKYLETLEEIDQMLLRKVFKAHSKTAIEAFYLEAGVIPLRFIIAKRRLMYLWTILRRPSNEMLGKVYRVQNIVKTPGDWANKVKEDLLEYGIVLADIDIKELSHFKYRKLVNENVEKAAHKYLSIKAAKHSKSENIMKSEKVKEKYLDDKRFTLSETHLLFQLRTRMISVKMNFPSILKDDVACRLCKDSVKIESKAHLLDCTEILKHVDVPNNIKHEDIFKDTDKQLAATKVFKKIIRQREILMNCSESD